RPTPKRAAYLRQGATRLIASSAMRRTRDRRSRRDPSSPQSDAIASILSEDRRQAGAGFPAPSEFQSPPLGARQVAWEEPLRKLEAELSSRADSSAPRA